MSAIAWWIIPALATLLAIVYVSWRSRPRPPEDTHDAIQAREAFKRVIEDDLRGRDAGDARPGRDSGTGTPDGPDDATDPPRA
jgi:hypothetical protein